MVGRGAGEGTWGIVWSVRGGREITVGGAGSAVRRLCGMAAGMAERGGAGETNWVLEETAGRSGGTGITNGLPETGGGGASRRPTADQDRQRVEWEAEGAEP